VFNKPIINGLIDSPKLIHYSMVNATQTFVKWVRTGADYTFTLFLYVDYIAYFPWSTAGSIFIFNHAISLNVKSNDSIISYSDCNNITYLK